MSTNDSIEVTAATVDDAVSEALQRLGAQEEDVSIEVLATPRSGVLGLGSRQARVRVTRRGAGVASSGVTEPPHAPPVSSPPLTHHELQQQQRAHQPRRPVVLDEQGDINGNVALPEPELSDRQPRDNRERQPRSGPPPRRGQPRGQRPSQQHQQPPQRPRRVEAEQETGGNRREESPEPPPVVHREPAEIESQTKDAQELLQQILSLMGEQATVEVLHADGEAIELEMKGDGSGILIGRHGQTLDALEYVVNRVLARKTHESIPILLETEAYRDRRRQQLHRMALSMGERAKRDHAPVRLEPMPPRDRRVIHLALKDDPMVTTRSAGEGFLRSVEILPTDTRDRGDRGGGGGGRGRRRNEPRQPALGEQGGFARGQKRIV